MPVKKKPEKKTIETFRHKEAARKNIPTAEYESVMDEDEKRSIFAAYERRDPDLDPQLIWRGKEVKDWSDLVVQAPPLYIQEKVHPKVLIDDLRRRTEKTEEKEEIQSALFSDLYSAFNGIEDGAKTEFYQHDQNWSNRMILGDSLQVMASLAEREGLRGQVQCIYIDPPYGIKFNSNFQWSTTDAGGTSNDAVKKMSREPEQVRAFRDTWRDGVHTYLSYLRDRLTVARDLLSDRGSIFLQIGDENVHRVRSVLDEVFGSDNFVSQVTFTKTEGLSEKSFSNVTDFILWYAKEKKISGHLNFKYRDLKKSKEPGDPGATGYVLLEDDDKTHWRPATATEVEAGQVRGFRFFDDQPLVSQDETEGDQPFIYCGRTFLPAAGRHWTTGKDVTKLERVAKANRIIQRGNRVEWKRYIDETAGTPLNNVWLGMGDRGFAGAKKTYVVETAAEVVKRCVLMTTEPGDLVLDPTCGSGTTAFVAEQWGRRWITIDTSRVALALARARIMGARYPYYLLADSPEGQQKEAEVTQTAPSSQPTFGKLRYGFIYERVPHITLKSIANNTEIDVIWEKWQEQLEPIRERINKALGKDWQEWEFPRELTFDNTEETPAHEDATLRAECSQLLREWWDARLERQQEIDASIAAKADFEYLYDKPYEDKRKVRVAGPFTVESLSPHRTLIVGVDDELIDPNESKVTSRSEGADFTTMVLNNLKTAGVQQAHREDKITFTSFKEGFAGDYISAEARYDESGTEKRAAIFVGPEFGTVSKPDLAAAAREAGDAGFDVLIACAFNYDAMSSEFDKLGRIPVLKARMNADLHMSDELKNTGKGNLFVIFGEPDIDILDAETGELYLPATSAEKIRVKVNGVDVFHPSTGKVESNGADGIACWFIDTDYNEESFFVRHAYFLGQNDPYKALKTSLKAEINEEAWSTLNSDISRPFPKPTSGRIAVKVINHLGDEVMKVFRV